MQEKLENAFDSPNFSNIYSLWQKRTRLIFNDQPFLVLRISENYCSRVLYTEVANRDLLFGGS